MLSPLTKSESVFYSSAQLCASQAIMIVAVPPMANASCTVDVINYITARLQTLHLHSFKPISWDFNHVTLTETLPTFKQFVDCKTRETKTLALLYSNIKEAYGSIALPSLGRSDHKLVYQMPLYKPLIQQQSTITLHNGHRKQRRLLRAVHR